MSLMLAMALLQAQPSEAAGDVFGRAGLWPVFQNERSCSTLVEYEGGETLHLDVRANEDRVLLTLSNPAWASLRNEERLQIELQVDDLDSWDANAVAFNDDGERGLILSFSGFDLIGELAVGNGVRFRRNGRPITDLSMRGSAAAFRLIAQCLDDLRRSDGYDPFDDGERPPPSPAVPAPLTSAPPPPPPRRPTLVEMLAERPRPAIPMTNAGTWVSQDDYPRESIEQGEFGLVRYRVTVRTNGRVDECEITQSSGFERLDERVCGRVEDRAQFAPALDASGVALEGVYENEFRWSLPIGLRR